MLKELYLHGQLIALLTHYVSTTRHDDQAPTGAQNTGVSLTFALDLFLRHLVAALCRRAWASS